MKKMFLVALAACISLILAGCANGLADSDEATISFTFPAEIVKSTIENDTTVSCSLNAMLYDAKSNELIEAKTVTVSSTNDIVINFSPITVGRSIFISVEYYKGTVLYASGFSKKQVVVEGTQSVTITLTRTDNGETITGTGIITGKSTMSDVSDNSNTIVYIEKKTTDSTDNSISSIATSSSSSITIKNVIAQTKAAKDGSFSFTGLAAGSYSVYAVNGATLEQAAFDTVSVENDKTTEVTLTFTAVGTIAGTVTINNSTLENDGLIVYIPGTNYVAVTKKNGTFVMTSVPATSADATYEVYALYNGNVYTVASSVTVTGGENTMLESYNISVQSLNVSYVSCRATDKGILFNGYVPHLYYNQSNDSGSDTVNVTIKDSENDIEATKTVITEGNWTVCYPFVTKGKEYTFNIQYTDKNYNNSYKDSITVTATGGYGEYKVANPTALKPVLSNDRVVSRPGEVKFEGDYTGAISRSGYTFDLARGTSWSDNNSMWLFEAKLYNDNSDGTYPLKDLQTLSNWRSFDYVDAMLKGNDYFLTTKTVIQVPMCPNWNFNMNDYQIVTNKWGGDRAKVLTIYGVVVDGDSRYLSYDADNLKDKVEMDKIITERGLKGMPGTPATVSMELKEGDNKKTVYYNTAVSYFGDRVYFPSEAPSGNKYRFDYWRFDSVSNLDFDQELTHTTSTEIVTATINGVSGEYYVDYMSAVFVMVGPVTVTLNYNDGATSSVPTVLKDNGTSSWKQFELPTKSPTREGFVFAGWSLDLTSDVTCSGTVTIEDDVTYYAKWVYDSSNKILGTWKGSDNNLYIVKSNNVIVLKSSSSYLEERPINVLSASSFTYGSTYTFTSSSATSATLTDSTNTVNVTMTRPTTSIEWSATNATVDSSTKSSASCTASSAYPTVKASISGLTSGKTYKLFFNTSSTNNTQINTETLSYRICSDSDLKDLLLEGLQSTFSNNLYTATVIATTTELYLNISYSLSYTQEQFSIDNLYIMEVTE